MSDDTPPEDQETTTSEMSFGSLLKEARVKKALSFEDVSSDLKISVKILNNLENSNIDELPKRAFTKGFIKTYSNYLGASTKEILELYDSNFESNTQLVETGVLKKSDAHETVFISDVFQKTIIPISILFLTVSGVFAVSYFLKSYKPTTTFSNTTENDDIINTEGSLENLANKEIKPNEGVSDESKAVEAETTDSKASINKVNILVVEPLDKTALLIKTNLDKKFIKARLNPNKPRTFKFESAEITFFDAGAVNLLFNGKDIGVPGNFGEQKLVRYPTKAVQ